MRKSRSFAPCFICEKLFVWIFQFVRRMIQTGRRVEFITNVSESQLAKNMLGRDVFRIMTCKQTFCMMIVKCIFNDCIGSFNSKSLSPEFGTKVETDFVRGLIVRTETAASDQFAGSQFEDWPILHPMCQVILDLFCESGFDIILREDPAGTDVSGYFRISPKQLCKRKIIGRPFGKSNSFCFDVKGSCHIINLIRLSARLFQHPAPVCLIRK